MFFSLHFTNPFLVLFLFHVLFRLILLYFQDATFISTAVFDHTKDTSMVRFFGL